MQNILMETLPGRIAYQDLKNASVEDFIYEFLTKKASSSYSSLNIESFMPNISWAKKNYQKEILFVFSLIKNTPLKISLNKKLKY